MPVSRISRVGVRSSTFGAGRWIGQRSSASTVARVVDRVAEQVEDAAEHDVADGHRDRAARVDHLGAAREPVGGVHRDRADAVVAQVLLHLEHEPGGVALLAGLLELDLERVVDLGELAVGEGHLDDDALHLLDRPDVALGPALLLGGLRCGFHSVSWVDPYRSPSAPATTSMISWVISAWRCRLAARVRSSMSSPALSDALRMALMRAPCSDAVDSSSAL